MQYQERDTFPTILLLTNEWGKEEKHLGRTPSPPVKIIDLVVKRIEEVST